MATSTRFAFQFWMLVNHVYSTGISFGIVTSTTHKTLDIKLTLYWMQSIYQCTVYPSQSSTYYGCDTINNSTTFQCNSTIIPPLTSYGLQIDNTHWTGIGIDQVIVNDTNNQIITISEYFNQSDTMDIDYGATGSSQSRLVVIDINYPSSSVEYKIDYDNPNFCYQCTPG